MVWKKGGHQIQRFLSEREFCEIYRRRGVVHENKPIVYKYCSLNKYTHMLIMFYQNHICNYRYIISSPFFQIHLQQFDIKIFYCSLPKYEEKNTHKKSQYIFFMVKSLRNYFTCIIQFSNVYTLYLYVSTGIQFLHAPWKMISRLPPTLFLLYFAVNSMINLVYHVLLLLFCLIQEIEKSKCGKL